jgi:hypothetical protein
MHELIVEVRGKGLRCSGGEGPVKFRMSKNRLPANAGPARQVTSGSTSRSIAATFPKAQPWTMSFKFVRSTPDFTRTRRPSFRKWDVEVRSNVAQLAPPVPVEDGIRLHLGGDPHELASVVRRLRKVLSVRVNRLGPVRSQLPRPLQRLTNLQLEALLVAHRLGYYEIPRLAGTMEVARELRIHKGTAGDHLRRVEKRVFDELLRGHG